MIMIEYGDKLSGTTTTVMIAYVTILNCDSFSIWFETYDVLDPNGKNYGNGTFIRKSINKDEIGKFLSEYDLYGSWSDYRKSIDF